MTVLLGDPDGDVVSAGRFVHVSAFFLAEKLDSSGFFSVRDRFRDLVESFSALPR